MKQTFSWENNWWNIIPCQRRLRQSYWNIFAEKWIVNDTVQFLSRSNLCARTTWLWQPSRRIILKFLLHSVPEFVLIPKGRSDNWRTNLHTIVSYYNNNQCSNGQQHQRRWISCSINITLRWFICNLLHPVQCIPQRSIETKGILVNKHHSPFFNLSILKDLKYQYLQHL